MERRGNGLDVDGLEKVARLAYRVHTLWALGNFGYNHSDEAIEAMEALGEALDQVKRDDWEE